MCRAECWCAIWGRLLMRKSLQASVAHVVARLVARRATPIDEIPELIAAVHRALVGLGKPLAAPSEERVEAAPARAPRKRRQAAPAAEPVPLSATEAATESLPNPPQPRLVRRAEIIPLTPAPEPPAMLAVRPGMLRGTVKWYDPRTRRGALRLQGCSDDVAIEGALLDEMAIARLYKGQEVEASLSDDAAPRVVRLTLPGGAWQVAASGGVVHNRHAKPVVVELKREALKRVAARAEAELVLGRRSGR
jgi:hypothetical protein